MTRCTLCHSARPVSPCPCEPSPHDPYACLTDAELVEQAGGVAEVVTRIDGPVPEGLREWGREVARRRERLDLTGGVL